MQVKPPAPGSDKIRYRPGRAVRPAFPSSRVGATGDDPKPSYRSDRPPVPERISTTGEPNLFKTRDHIVNRINNRRHSRQALVVGDTVGRSSLGGYAASSIRGWVYVDLVAEPSLGWMSGGEANDPPGPWGDLVVKRQNWQLPASSTT